MNEGINVEFVDDNRQGPPRISWLLELSFKAVKPWLTKHSSAFQSIDRLYRINF